jgi:hypothetical protein
VFAASSIDPSPTPESFNQRSTTVVPSTTRRQPSSVSERNR